MITVLADDLTGGAEIAGVCLRYGLSVAFDFDFQIERFPLLTDVWIIATDTRSALEKDACDTVRAIAHRLKQTQTDAIFKKIDSALRGHVVAEIEALRECFPIEKALILPANPDTGRIIKDGVYFVGSLPLHQTAFANDPDFPATTSIVREMPGLSMNNCGFEIITPDILSVDDYKNYAKHLHSGVLPVGGSVFFEACLPVFFPSINRDAKPVGNERKFLMICGSTHEASIRFARENRIFERLEIDSAHVEELLDNPNMLKGLLILAARMVERHNKLLVEVRNKSGISVSSDKVKELLARITADLVKECGINELFIEGGATARACARAAGFSSLVPVCEYSRGVVRFKVSGAGNLHLTVKPGSYEWSYKLFE